MSQPSRIALLGIPLEVGASQRGTLMGPDALRTAGIGKMPARVDADRSRLRRLRK